MSSCRRLDLALELVGVGVDLLLDQLVGPFRRPFELRTWGWIVLIIGALQVLAGFGIFARNQFARWFGVAVAAVNLIAALTSISAYPFWALVIIGIDVLVIYGLAAYGDRLDRASTPA